jgi:hypothetical protein
MPIRFKVGYAYDTLLSGKRFAVPRAITKCICPVLFECNDHIMYDVH